MNKKIIVGICLLSLLVLVGCSTPNKMLKFRASLLKGDESNCKLLCLNTKDIGPLNEDIKDGRIEDGWCVCYDECVVDCCDTRCDACS